MSFNLKMVLRSGNVKKKASVILSFVLIFFVICLSSCNKSVYSEEVLLYTAEDLLKIEAEDNRCFKLMNDIDCQGKTFTGIEKFKGIFDGNGYKISNINITSNNNCYGFFSSANRVAQIKNLAIVDFNIDINKTSSNEELFAGGLVGYFTAIRDDGVIGGISQCYIEGDINLNVASKNNYIGGVAGSRTGGTFSDVFCATNIYNRCEYGMNQQRYLGGLFGINSGEVSHCIYAGSITDVGANDGIFNTLKFAKTTIGGLVGLSSGNYTSYSSCVITPLYVGSQCADSNLYISPIVGAYENYCNPSVTECYYTVYYYSDIVYWQKITSTSYGYDMSRKIGNSRLTLWTSDFLMGNPKNIPGAMYHHYTEHGEEIPIKLDFSEEIWYFTTNLIEDEIPDYPMPKIFK